MRRLQRLLPDRNYIWVAVRRVVYKNEPFKRKILEQS